MFLVEEKTAPNGQCSALIYMRPDGLFEGRIHRKRDQNDAPDRWANDYEVCAVTETLPRAKMIVYEELGL